MTFSMTGYGKSSAAYKGRLLTVEIRTLNSKQADLNLKIPSLYREKEFDLRDLLSNALGRGKIDFNIQRDLAPGEASSALNEALFGTYYDLLKRLEANMVEEKGQRTTDYLSLIMKMPDAMKPAGDDLELAEWETLMVAVHDCIARVNAFRQQEGEKLALVLKESIEKILEALKKVEPMEAERTARIRGRIKGNFNEETEAMTFDHDRFEQELIYYLEKLDITEEKVRLKAHCDFFIKTIDEEEFKGKKLSFISQEIGREINTLGSKAQHAEMQRLVVGMKDELEKIKEQILNIL